jgi:hypothetical protein
MWERRASGIPTRPDAIGAWFSCCCTFDGRSEGVRTGRAGLTGGAVRATREVIKVGIPHCSRNGSLRILHIQRTYPIVQTYDSSGSRRGRPVQEEVVCVCSRGAKPASTTDDLPLPEAPTSAVNVRRATTSSSRVIAASRPKNRALSCGPKYASPG